jgi:hypothetical protein
MAVETEQFGQAQLSGVSWQSEPLNLTRQRSGSWAFLLRLNGEVTLPDGRIVAINRRIRVKATEQIGRKRSA